MHTDRDRGRGRSREREREEEGQKRVREIGVEKGGRGERDYSSLMTKVCGNARQ